MHGPQQMCVSFMNRKSALSQGTIQLDQSHCENKHPLSCEQTSDVTALITQRKARFAQGSVEHGIQSINTLLTHLHHTYRQQGWPEHVCFTPNLNQVELPLSTSHFLWAATAWPFPPAFSLLQWAQHFLRLSNQKFPSNILSVISTHSWNFNPSTDPYVRSA